MGRATVDAQRRFALGAGGGQRGRDRGGDVGVGCQRRAFVRAAERQPWFRHRLGRKILASTTAGRAFDRARSRNRSTKEIDASEAVALVIRLDDRDAGDTVGDPGVCVARDDRVDCARRQRARELKDLAVGLARREIVGCGQARARAAHVRDDDDDRRVPVPQILRRGDYGRRQREGAQASEVRGQGDRTQCRRSRGR